MSITPDIWGKHLWFSIHIIALAYPMKPTYVDIENYKLFFTHLQHVIPCYKCAENYKKHLEILPIALDDNEKLFEWTVKMHNLVNKMNGKDEWSLEKAKKFYLNFGKNTKKHTPQSNNNNYLIFIAIFAIIIAVCFFARRR